MALITSRINLSSNQFPLLSELHGRTIIVGTHDQNFTPGAQLNPHADTGEVGIPQVYYAHNILPTPQGYKSIGYFLYANPSGVSYDFQYAITVRDSSGNLGTIGITTSGQLYLLQFGSSTWIALISPPGLAGARVTTAFVNGVTYIYFEYVGCYVYNFATFTIVPTVLAGLSATNVRGIVGSNGYMIAFARDNSIAWSSVITPTDFQPSLITGAGGGRIDGLQGNIVAAVTIYGGFIIFGDTNAVAGIFQANDRFPFAFKPVASCGGLSSANNCTYQAYDSDRAYAYTTSGLQAVSLLKAEFLFPAATEFLSGSRLEDFDEVTDTLSITNLSTVLKKQTAFIADRYLVISYGINFFTHAIVLDILLGRVGKLKVDHVAIFEFQLYDQTIYETPKKSIGVLLNDGTVKLVDADISSVYSNGVMILGKYQYVRARWMNMQAVEFENSIISSETTVAIYPSFDGKTLAPLVSGYKVTVPNGSLVQSYKFNTTAYNHSLLIKGRFNAVSGIISYQVAGKTGLS